MELNDQEIDTLKVMIQYDLGQLMSSTHKAIIKTILMKLQDYEDIK